MNCINVKYKQNEYDKQNKQIKQSQKEHSIYENNLIIGKANKYLLPFTNKIFVASTGVIGEPFPFKKIISTNAC